MGFDPTIFLYDNVPGGVGLAARLFDQRDELLRRARAAARVVRLRGRLPRVHRPGRGRHARERAPVDHPRKRLGLEILSALGVVALQ